MEQDECVVTEAAARHRSQVSVPPSDADYGGGRLGRGHKTHCGLPAPRSSSSSSRLGAARLQEEILTSGFTGANTSKIKMDGQRQDEQEPEQEASTANRTKRQETRTKRDLSHRIACLIIKLLIIFHLIERAAWLYAGPHSVTQALASQAQPEEIKMAAAGAQTRSLLGKLLNEDQLLSAESSYSQADSHPDGLSSGAHHRNTRHRRNSRDHQHHNHNHHHHHHHQHAPTHHHHKRRHQSATGGFSSDAERPLVMTNKGQVRGISQKLHTGKFVDAFLGIPYAQPPVGKFRFRHPLPTNPWRDVLDASHLPHSCYQVSDIHFGSNFSGTSIWNPNTPLSEDCLYLNVWAPFGAADATAARRAPKRAVLVWIYGGCFYSGTSSLAMYDGGVLASEEDIIVVSMNYRVAMLGFLYFGRPEAPGNAGMFDQLLALQWVNDNIEQFGGDPRRVTLFGESAGAVSVAFHLLSPLSRNLFSQAILQSGAATNPWAYMDEAEIRANGLQVAAKVGCSASSSNGTAATNEQQLDVVVECLLRTDPMTLVSTETGRLKNVINFPFVPVIDGSFLLENPRESLIKSNFKHTRILLGSNSDEGNYFLVYLPEFNVCTSATGTSGGGASSASNLPLPPPLSSTPPAAASAADQELGQVGGVSSPVLEEEGGGGPASFAAQSASTGGGGSAEIEGTQEGASVYYAREAQHRSVVGEQQQVHADSAGARASCKPIELPSINRSDFIKSINEDLNPYAGHPVGKSAIIFEYSNWNNPGDPVSNYDAYDKIVGDFHFTCPVRELAQRYAEAGNTVYMYYFRHRSSVSAWPKWMGVLHGDEISYIFGEPLNPALRYTPKEVELSRRMMRYWANFARFGNPTKLDENSTMNEKWPEYADRRQYFELNPEYVRLGRGPRAKQCTFWSHYLPKLIDSFDSRSQCLSSGLSETRPSEQLQMDWRREQQFEQELRASRAGDSLLTGGSQLLSGPSALVALVCLLLVLAIVGVLAYGRRTGRFELSFLSQHANSSSSSSGPSVAATNN